MMESDFTVHLDTVFQGPMDLLLHLIREQEVEIYEIEIHTVIRGYLAYLQAMAELDIELAGDFLVMASTLMAIKSRSLLPREEVNLEEELDPRDELIQRLVEYRRFKEASDGLHDRYIEQNRCFPRGNREELPKEEIERSIDLGDLTHWDLLSTYSRLLRETMQDRPHRIVNEGRPMRYYVDRIARTVRELRDTTLSGLMNQLKEGETVDRETLVGSFCALLELIKIGVVKVKQEVECGEISIRLSAEHAADVEGIVRASRFDDEIEEEPVEARSEAAEPATEADPPSEPDSESDSDQLP